MIKGGVDMATANLYIINDDRRKADKKLSNIIKENVNITYKDATEFIRPIIVLDYDGSWNMRDCNYIYLSDKNRYYFVEKHSFQKGQKVVYELLEDVRTSHKEGIRSLICTVTRNENLKNGYLHDSNYSVYAYEQIVCKMFPNSINQDSIILMTVG